MTDELHVVFGAGQVGSKLAERLWEAGHRVRVVRRGGAAQDRERYQWRRGDVMDEAFAVAAAAGATAVYNCVNPQYHQWLERLPPMVRHIRLAATRAQARLVVLDNVYAYGPTGGAPMTERTPLAATTVKGGLRRQLFEETIAAHQRGEVRVAVAKAADFVGPGVVESAVFLPDVYRALLAGKTATVIVELDQPHAYTDVRDVVEVLFTLGTDARGEGRAWHVPTAAPLTTRAYLGRLAAAMGTTAKLRRLPLWALRLAGVFSPLIRQFPEMAYQWQAPFILDGSDFTRTFGLQPRSIDESVAATAAWAAKTWAPAQARAAGAPGAAAA